MLMVLEFAFFSTYINLKIVIQKFNNLVMEKSTSKNEQQINEGFSGKNVSKNDSLTTPDLKKEVEKDAEGTIEQVNRARYVGKNLEDSKPIPLMDFLTESIHQTTETAEHKDFNSNPNPDEFPDKIKKNRQNKGNMDN
jgi:hypothetical protein